MGELNALQVKAYLETCQNEAHSQQPLLLDIRQPWEYDVCNIDNSALVPMSQIPAKVESFDSSRETIIICHHGSRSVGRYLEQNGFDSIINLSGGVDQWAKTVDNKMSTY